MDVGLLYCKMFGVGRGVSALFLLCDSAVQVGEQISQSGYCS